MTRENSVLENNQIKEYDPIVAEYIFECEGAGVTSPKSPRLKAKKAGIKLHFFRYGLFHNSQKEKFIDNKPTPLLSSYNQAQHAETIEEVNPEGVPKVEDFFYARTALNKGYLYIFDDTDPNLWYEYEVDDLSNLHPIYWADNKENGQYKDARKCSRQIFTSLTFKQDQVLWVAFSSIQWSIDYHHVMHTDATRRAERMIQIRCSGFDPNSKSNQLDFLPFDEMYGTFYNTDPHPLWFNDKLQDIMADDRTTREKDPKAIKEDMFITLHDPLGMIQDASGFYADKILHFKALVEAIQTGESIDEAYQRIVAEENFDTSKNKDHQHLFSLANMSYHHIYDNSKHIEKYSEALSHEKSYEYSSNYRAAKDAFNETPEYARRHIRGFKFRKASNNYRGADLEKLEGILGVEERKQERKKLIAIRNIVFDLFKEAYPFKYLEDFVHNTQNNTVHGRYCLLPIVDTLYLNPYNIDANLLLNKDRKTEDNIQKDLLFLITQDEKEKALPPGFKQKLTSYIKPGQNLFLFMLAGQISGELSERSNNDLKTDVCVKVAAIVKSTMAYFADKAFTTIKASGKTYRGFISSAHETIVNGINNNILLNKQNLAALNSKGIVLTISDHYVMLSTEGSGALKLDILSQQPGDYNVSTYRSQPLTASQQRNNKFNSKLAKLVNADAFHGVFGLIAIFNLHKSITEFDNSQKLRSAVNVFGYTVGVAEVALAFKESIVKKELAKRTDKFAKLIINKAEFHTKLAGAAGVIITCGICIYDSCALFREDDIDAGAALVGAGIGFALSGILPLCIKSIAMAGPLGWAALIVGTGLYFLSEALKDDDLQKIYKHYLLSNYKECPKAGLSPIAYSQKILSQKKRLTDPDYRANRSDKKRPNLEDPHQAFLKLAEELIMPTIQVKGTGTVTGDRNILYGWYNRFEIAIPFLHHFNSDECLNNALVDVKFYPRHENSYASMRTDNVTFTKEKKGVFLKIKVNIDKHTKNVGSGAFCKVYVRLKLSHGSKDFFPYNDTEGKQRVIVITLKLNHDVRANNPLKGSYSIVTLS
ncbi:hypothetical protein DMA11_01860 [Marinilabiliaceae bacterium JC017]|nr:hypothetical protein DMA11_01860 [Marinilabiliaceae bacterium JC017]